MLYTLKSNQTGCTEQVIVEQLVNGGYVMINAALQQTINHKPTDQDVLDFVGNICIDDWYIEAKPIFRKDGSRVYTHTRKVVKGRDCLVDQADNILPIVSETIDTIEAKCRKSVRNTNRQTNNPYWLKTNDYEIQTFYKCLVEDKTN